VEFSISLKLALLGKRPKWGEGGNRVKGGSGSERVMVSRVDLRGSDAEQGGQRGSALFQGKYN